MLEITDKIILLLQESPNNTGDFTAFLHALNVHKTYFMRETRSAAVWHCTIPDNIVKREVDVNGIRIYMAMIPVKNVEKLVINCRHSSVGRAEHL